MSLQAPVAGDGWEGKDGVVSKISFIADWVLRSPLLWGGLASLMFYALLHSGTVSNPQIERYFQGHPVEYITTVMFFIAMAALVIRLTGVVGQLSLNSRNLLDPIPAGGQPVEDAGGLVLAIDELPSYLRKSYLGCRLREALEYVRRKGSAESLEQQLRHLEDQDADRMASGYAFVRILVWAIPTLGFLGTVIGITLAIMQLNPQSLEASLTEVTTALGVAFDTTALALALSILIMMAKFAVETTEENLLQTVDERTSHELIGRFQTFGFGNDPQVASVSRMCDQVVTAVEAMAARQAELWSSTISETHEQWARVTQSAGSTLQQALTESLRENLQDHASGLIAGTEQQLRELNASFSHHTAELGASIEEQSKLSTITAQQQTKLLAETMATQIETMSTTVASQVETLSTNVQQQSEKLGSGADRLLGNLSGGLERMAELLVEALQRHGETLTEAEEQLASENRRHLGEVEAALGEAMVLSADRQEKLIGRSEKLLQQMQTALLAAAEATIAHQEQLVKQGEVLLKVVDSTGQINKMEQSLSRNLETVGRVHNFEETLMSLAAAIQLLSAKVGKPAAGDSTLPQSHAA